MNEQWFGAGAARLAGMAALALGWRPSEFWDATPAELALAIGGGAAADGGGEAVARDEVAVLMARFPDA